MFYEVARAKNSDSAIVCFNCSQHIANSLFNMFESISAKISVNNIAC